MPDLALPPLTIEAFGLVTYPPGLSPDDVARLVAEADATRTPPTEDLT
jgi:hypothetical protein